jgi:hypothetical protein
LYYYDFFTEEICKNFDLTEHSRPEAEVANAYARSLYEMMQAMGDWLAAIEEVGGEQNEVPNHIRIQSVDTHRGASIGKAAAICFCSCHRRILAEESIPSRLKQIFTKKLVFKIADFREHDEQSHLWKYSAVMLRYVEENVAEGEDDEYLFPFREAYSYGGPMATDLQNELVVKGRGADLRSELDDLLGFGSP